MEYLLPFGYTGLIVFWYPYPEPGCLVGSRNLGGRILGAVRS